MDNLLMSKLLDVDVRYEQRQPTRLLNHE